MIVAKNVLSMAKEVDLRPVLSTLVTAPKFTIRQKISVITNLLRSRGRANFASLLNKHDARLEIVVTFLAVLELVKLHLVKAYQERLFGEIELEKDGSWKEAEEFDLEFGE
jgi:segregation and condensation protein A